MASRADELELYVASDDHYGGVVDSTGKYAPCDEFADRDQAQAIIRELESERDQLKARCDERIEAKKTALRELQEAFNECYEEGMQTARERDQLQRERDEARRRVESLDELVRFCRAERDRARKIACKLYAENAACNDLETNRQDCCAACGWNYDALFPEES